LHDKVSKYLYSGCEKRIHIRSLFYGLEEL
jgi:hypothetical protein